MPLEKYADIYVHPFNIMPTKMTLKKLWDRRQTEYQTFPAEYVQVELELSLVFVPFEAVVDIGTDGT
jgi:hypothetical protein